MSLLLVQIATGYDVDQAAVFMRVFLFCIVQRIQHSSRYTRRATETEYNVIASFNVSIGHHIKTAQNSVKSTKP